MPTSFQRTLVTSALPYANGHIHLGHLAGAYLPADIYVRYLRLRGRPCLYVCGSDEHGVPITLTALKEGVAPQDVIDRYHTANAAAFAEARQGFDIYGRTSWPEHIETTQAFFRTLYDGGHIEQKTMKLWYSAQSDRYLPDRYVKGACPRCGYTDATGDECENCGAQYATEDLKDPRANIPGDSSTPELRESRHWFLKLQDFQQALRDWVDGHPEWRANARGIAKGWIEDLRSRCITRDSDWGVPIPLDDPDAARKRIYVWFDAPIGYVTNTLRWAADHNLPDGLQTWWKDPETRLVHFIGKDNVPFHAVIFPAMLMGQGDYILPDNVVANEFLNVLNRETGLAEKGSKSKGNMISVKWFMEKVSADAARYYLCAIMPETSDSAFDWDEFMNRYNGELCDVVGNFVHRSLTMTVKNFDGKVPEPGPLDAEDQALLDGLDAQLDAVAESLENFRFRQALERFIDIGRKANQYFDTKQPWATRKTDLQRTATTLYCCCQVVHTLSLAMGPFVPDGAARLAHILDVPMENHGWHGGHDCWNDGHKPMKPGKPIETPEVLFPKLDKDYIEELAEAHRRGEAF